MNYAVWGVLFCSSLHDDKVGKKRKKTMEWTVNTPLDTIVYASKISQKENHSLHTSVLVFVSLELFSPLYNMHIVLLLEFGKLKMRKQSKTSGKQNRYFLGISLMEAELVN